MPRVGRTLKALWSFVRQILSIRGLLDWLGWKQSVGAGLTSVFLLLCGWGKGLSTPNLILLALGAFAAVIIIWRSVTIGRSQEEYGWDAQVGEALLITRAVFRCDQDKTCGNDVTKEVQRLVNGKSLTIRAHQDSGLGDPCQKHRPFPPGHTKSLEIDYTWTGKKLIPYDKTAKLTVGRWKLS